jgi:hypothetical protein
LLSRLVALDADQVQDLATGQAVGMLADDLEDRLALLAPAAADALLNSLGLAFRCLVIGLDRCELAFERLELSVQLCFFLSGLVPGLLQPRALALHEVLECFCFRHS